MFSSAIVASQKLGGGSWEEKRIYHMSAVAGKGTLWHLDRDTVNRSTACLATNSHNVHVLRVPSTRVNGDETNFVSYFE